MIGRLERILICAACLQWRALGTMGQVTSLLTECLGTLGGGGGGAVRYGRVSGARRVEAGAPSEVSRHAAPPPPPPAPLVADKAMVYDLMDDEDVCPTCLENYSAENPQIVAQCGHAFHLQCIVEWETRSGSPYCPICAKPMQYREKGAVAKPV